MSLAIPIYIGETIHRSVRGTLGLLPAVFDNFAIFLCYLLGTYLNGEKLAWIGCAICLPFIALVFIIPESPIWHITKGNEEKAIESLQWLRGNEVNVESELQDMILSFAAAQRRSSTKQIVNLTKLDNLKPLFMSLGLMFFQQFGGINAVIFYTESIFRDSGSSIDKNGCAMIIGVVNLISTIIATALIDRLGRKVLLCISSAIMSTTLMLLGSIFYYKDEGRDTSSLGWLTLSTFLLYVFGFSLGLGPIPWLM